MAERPKHQPPALVFLEYYRQQKTVWREYTQPSLNADCRDLIAIRDLQPTTGEREILGSIDDHLTAGIMKLSLNENKSQRFVDRLADPKTIVTSFFAAEFFPDLNPPKLIVADDPLDLHSDLREKSPELSTLPRISGEVLTLKDIGPDGPKFVLLDAVRLKTNRKLLTKAQLKEVAQRLIDMNYVPLDAECHIIDPSKLTPPKPLKTAKLDLKLAAKNRS